MNEAALLKLKVIVERAVRPVKATIFVVRVVSRLRVDQLCVGLLTKRPGDGNRQTRYESQLDFRECIFVDSRMACESGFV